MIAQLGNPPSEWLEESEISIKYKNYIEKEQELADKLSNLEELKLDSTFNYSTISSLSYEARGKTRKN